VRLGNCVEDIGGGGRAGHGLNIFQYRYMSSAATRAPLLGAPGARSLAWARQRPGRWRVVRRTPYYSLP
jgi:hypothetical protein